jgi:mannosyl-oligosaccharide glucosidase
MFGLIDTLEDNTESYWLGDSILSNGEDKLFETLKLLSDESHLFSPHGIRSLSMQDQFYRHSSDYWRGAIWINVNYLVLKGLHTHYLSYAKTQGDSHISAQKIYSELRLNLLNTVFSNWRQNHIFWE